MALDSGAIFTSSWSHAPTASGRKGIHQKELFKKIVDLFFPLELFNYGDVCPIMPFLHFLLFHQSTEK